MATLDSPTTELKSGSTPSTVQTSEAPTTWSFLGFEWFDIVVIICQCMFFLAAIPLDQFLLHPATKCIGAIGYFGCLYFLGRTRIYATGFQSIKKAHGYIQIATGLGGILSGIMVSVGIMIPFGDFLRQLHIGSDWAILIALPGMIFCVALVPYLANRVSEEDEVIEFIECPRWVHWLGRAFILIMANIMLLLIYDMFQGEAEDNLLARSIMVSFGMTAFYVPVRVQEMFLRPNGPHLQSLVQTTAMIIFCGTAPAWLH